MRILHVIPGMAESSGPTGALRCLAAAQATAGHEVSIAYVTGRGADAREPNVAGCDLLGFPAERFRHWAYSPALRRWLREQVRCFDVVHVHSMWLYPNLVATAAARRHGVPYWIRPAGSLEPWCLEHKALRKRAYFALLERRTLTHAAVVHAVSEQEVVGIRAAGYRGRVLCIPNGVDVASFKPDVSRAAARTHFGLRDSAPWIVYVGRIHQKKGLSLMVEVLARVREHFPDVRFAVVGPDRHEYADSLKSEYAGRGLADAVEFLGERTGDEKALAYRVGDVFVLPSHSENFGIVVAESLASATPVVVSHETPWRHLDELSIGRCCERAVEPFVSAVLEVLREQDLGNAMGGKGLTYVREQHDWSKIAERVVRGYQGSQEDAR